MVLTRWLFGRYLFWRGFQGTFPELKQEFSSRTASWSLESGSTLEFPIGKIYYEFSMESFDIEVNSHVYTKGLV